MQKINGEFLHHIIIFVVELLAGGSCKPFELSASHTLFAAMAVAEVVSKLMGF
ncbi:hypothetical protein [Mesorhizobium sp.]|uniref:hypothetical protein n=1 Tax=Mesorhizobium sp. TaxID=1871066 RepID=UPI0025FAFBE1|nr:hypothetical protein [Mesorhizobium sp.]